MPLYGSGSGQPLDSDLTAIAALSTTAYGRALLELADAGAGRTALGLGTAATHAHGDYDAAGAAAAAAAASQPVDSDLTAIAALSTTSYGRALLALADAAAGRTALDVPSNSDLSTHAADTTSVHGITDTSVLATATTLATAVSDHSADTTSVHGITDTSALATDAELDAVEAAAQPLDSDLTAIAALTSAVDKLPYATGAGTWSVTTLTSYIRTLLDDADASAARATLDAAQFAHVARHEINGADVLAPSRIGAFASIGTAAGRYFGANIGAGTVLTIMPAARLYLIPCFLPRTLSVDRIGCQVTTQGSANSVIRLGIYAPDGGEGEPSTLILDAGTVASTTNGSKEITISQSLASYGMVWLAGVAQGAPTTEPIVRTPGNVSQGTSGANLSNATAANTGRYQTGVTGALPDPFVVSSDAVNEGIKLVVRAA